jgi:ribosomal RNA-processing protein 12
MAPSIATSLGGKSMGAESMGGRSMGVRSTKSTPPFGRGNNRHSGDRYKANKANKASGGDAKGSSKVEPYAYWPLDRNMLNRRAQKTRVAKKGLDKVVKAAKEGAARGLKAKRQRR